MWLACVYSCVFGSLPVSSLSDHVLALQGDVSMLQPMGLWGCVFFLMWSLSMASTND